MSCFLTCFHVCLPAKEMSKDYDCSLPVEKAGIIWDSICCFFLLLQCHVFLSYYLLHVMLDLQAHALQASRWNWGPSRGARVRVSPFHPPAVPISTGVLHCSRPAP